MFSQSARQGIAVLMASFVMVLKRETSTLRQSHKLQFNINWFHIWRGWLRYGDHHLCQMWFGSDERSSRHVRATYTGTVTFNSLFYSSTELQPIPENRFSRTIAPKTRSGVRKTHSGMRNVHYSNIQGYFTLKTFLKLVGMGNYQPNKIWNNFETVRNTRNMSMTHNYETGVALSESVMKTCVRRTLAENSRWRQAI